LISRSVGADEQGGVQGALTSIGSLAGIAGPPLMAGTFGYFVHDGRSWQVPGAAFFLATALVLVAMVMAARLFRRHAAAATNN
jgi:DHA1 family tetracycline resistance protein-like MFS transporter